MCDDNLLDILISGGDLNNVTPIPNEDLSVVKENAEPLYYEINRNNKKPEKDNG